jgi:hypothetical protein
MVTLIHVLITVVAAMSGTVVARDMLVSRVDKTWTALFLTFTVLTSATGFLFPFTKILPAHIVGAISLVVLAIASFAFYVRKLAGPWRWIYVSTAILAFYLNVFVGVVQMFQKIPVLQQSSPTQTELPFATTQLVILLATIALGVAATRRFHPKSPENS